MREAWEANAEEWILWARSPKHSHPFWRFHLPRFVEVLPPPGRLTLDIGCGEGRLGRELSRRGHCVFGLDGAPALRASRRLLTATVSRQSRATPRRCRFGAGALTSSSR